jgi:hypothetical protein
MARAYHAIIIGGGHNGYEGAACLGFVCGGMGPISQIMSEAT